MSAVSPTGEPRRNPASGSEYSRYFTAPTQRRGRGSAPSHAMDRIRIVAVFGVPRTGTSHLFEVIRNADNLMVYKELFHPAAAFGIQHRPEDLEELSTELRQDFGSIFDERLRTWLQAHPERFLDFALERPYGRNKHLIFKIFPGHLKAESIKQTILSRPDTASIIVQRRPIDAYISGVKAEQLGRHRRIDTTAVAPLLSTTAYVRWWNSRKDWYDDVKGWLDDQGVSYRFMTYENDILGEPVLVFRKFIMTCRELGVALHHTKWTHDGLDKQDLQLDYDKKVGNWPAFRDEIFKKGHEKLLYEYFLDPCS